MQQTTPPQLGTLLVDRQDIAAVISTRDAIDVVTTVFRAHADGRTALPPKTTLDLRPHGIDGWHIAMPGFDQTSAAAGIKWVGGYTANAHLGLPFVMALLILQEAETGYPLAIMEASGLTTLRTGAVAAVCVKQFSRPGAGVCGLIGAGAQAEAALRAVILLTPFREVRIHASHRHSAVRLAEKIQTHFETVTVHENARDVIVGSDLVLTATTANAPLVDRDWIAPGATIISLGSFQELDDQLVLGADKLIVDSWVQCAERGELARLVKAARLFRQDVFAEIGEVLTGRKPGREGEQETILIVPIGLATHDLALAKLAYNRLVGAPNATTFRFL